MGKKYAALTVTLEVEYLNVSLSIPEKKSLAAVTLDKSANCQTSKVGSFSTVVVVFVLFCILFNISSNTGEGGIYLECLLNAKSLSQTRKGNKKVLLWYIVYTSI